MATRDMSQCSPDVVPLCRGPLTQLQRAAELVLSSCSRPLGPCHAPSALRLPGSIFKSSCSEHVPLWPYPDSAWSTVALLVTSLPYWLVSFSMCKIPAKTFYLQSPYTPPTFRPPCFPFYLLPYRSWQVPQKGGLWTWTPEGQDGGAMREAVLNCAWLKP